MNINDLAERFSEIVESFNPDRFFIHQNFTCACGEVYNRQNELTKHHARKDCPLFPSSIIKSIESDGEHNDSSYSEENNQE